jgi:hypothetical protein
MRGVDGRPAVTTLITSIHSGMERLPGTPVERIISRINGSAPRGGVMQGGQADGSGRTPRIGAAVSQSHKWW